MPEGNLQVSRRLELLAALRRWYAKRGVEGAWVCCDINIYYREGDPKTVVSPDVAVAFGVDAAAQEPETTYKVWETSAAPCWVLEIASAKTVRTDLHVKPAKYAELGVQEYWRIDPTGGELLDPPLQGERRRSGRWIPIEVTADRDGLQGRSDVLGLDLCWRPPKLRLWDISAGAWLLDPEELDELAEQAEARTAEAEARTAEAEAELAAEAAARQAAEAELAELRAMLE